MSAQSDQDPPPGGPAGASGQPDRASHLGYVTHEVRNPLSTALWTAELLARMPPADRAGARGDKLALICLRSVGRVRLLVEDHLLCERLDAGGYPVRREPVPLSEALAVAKARWPDEGAALSLPPEGPLAALADRALLERALDALVAAAGGSQGAVRVEAEARGAMLEIRVSGGPVASLADPGKGAPSDQRGRALALPLARRVAVALGGSLTVSGDGYRLAIPLA
jgi:signal transduction histidine kinase